MSCVVLAHPAHRVPMSRIARPLLRGCARSPSGRAAPGHTSLPHRLHAFSVLGGLPVSVPGFLCDGRPRSALLFAMGVGAWRPPVPEVSFTVPATVFLSSLVLVAAGLAGTGISGVASPTRGRASANRSSDANAVRNSVIGAMAEFRHHLSRCPFPCFAPLRGPPGQCPDFRGVLPEFRLQRRARD